MFDKSEASILRKKNKLLKTKDLFITTCKRIIKENHSDDWDELEEGFTKCLEDHLEYWEQVINGIFICAEEVTSDLLQDQQKSKNEFEEFLQQLLALNPKNTSKMLEHFTMEDTLRQIFRDDNYTALKDARATRDRIDIMQFQKVQTGLISRREKITQNKILLDKKADCTRKGFEDAIIKAYNYASSKRKVEF